VGQVGGILTATGGKPIDLTFTYQHGKRTLKGSSQLEVKSFLRMDASAKPPELAARSLDKIADSLSDVPRR
jgi:hypothetical protein